MSITKCKLLLPTYHVPSVPQWTHTDNQCVREKWLIMRECFPKQPFSLWSFSLHLQGNSAKETGKAKMGLKLIIWWDTKIVDSNNNLNFMAHYNLPQIWLANLRFSGDNYLCISSILCSLELKILLPLLLLTSSLFLSSQSTCLINIMRLNSDK